MFDGVGHSSSTAEGHFFDFRVKNTKFLQELLKIVTFYAGTLAITG